jgi:hypothetical protein
MNRSFVGPGLIRCRFFDGKSELGLVAEAEGLTDIAAQVQVEE